MGEWPTQTVNDFRGRPLPEPAVPAGYAALMTRYDLRTPTPPQLVAIAVRHHPAPDDGWTLFGPRYQPAPDLRAQLTFALRYEGVDLQLLSALFAVAPGEAFVAIIRETPTSGFARRLWFLYEWLTGRALDLPDAGKVRAVPVLDPDQQFALTNGQPSTRHRVIDNLPGTPAFCPLVRRTPELERFIQRDLAAAARAVVGRTRPDLMARAAAFILLSDSKSSFAIEGETPSGERTARWGQAIAQAGSRALNRAELDRLQRVVIGDARFVRLGLRQEGGFVGAHDRHSNQPVPDHVSARHQDLAELMDGLTAYAGRAVRGGMDAVVAAASLAFGFVYIHPYVDGNGRLHRWLIHHVLAAAGFSPPGLVFPVSAAILRQIGAYRTVLESYSAPLLPMIDWRPTPQGNVEVLNDTAALYRYFDATAHATFLYACVARTLEEDLPEEVAFLEAYDAFADGLNRLVDMPAARIELLRSFLAQNGGRLSRRARENEFALLTEAETEAIEALYADTFNPAH